LLFFSANLGPRASSPSQSYPQSHHRACRKATSEHS
jgi:hypothetical protein